jgi:Rrf2 family protein
MKGKPVLVRELSKATTIPQAFLAKIINTLGRKRLVSTQRGIGGGISLAREPESITLYEICEMLDDPILKSRCILGMIECSDESGCPVHHFWAQKQKEEIDFLHKTTLADIAIAQERQERTRKGET